MMNVSLLLDLGTFVHVLGLFGESQVLKFEGAFSLEALNRGPVHCRYIYCMVDELNARTLFHEYGYL